MDKLTSRFQQALSDAQSLAVGRDHNMIEPCTCAGRLARPAGRQHAPAAGAGRRQRAAAARAPGRELDKLPKVSGQEGNLSVGNDLTRLLNLTDKLAQQRGDAYIASELFVLAALEDKGESGKALKAAGGDKAAAGSRHRQACAVARRSGRERRGARQALEKYTIDLTARAEAASSIR
jgi:ATP-dependent Clp protease ATP-binding subunit ClpB